MTMALTRDFKETIRNGPSERRLQARLPAPLWT